MATFKVVPIDMISAPNYWAPLTEARWTITDPNAVTLSLQLEISDSLGERRYILATGGTLTAIFQRADAYSSSNSPAGSLVQTSQTISISCVVNANDRSLFTLPMTQQQVQGVVSGTVKFSMVESGVTTIWNQNYLLVKKLTGPGF
jgi:hypothetical protein